MTRGRLRWWLAGLALVALGALSLTQSPFAVIGPGPAPRLVPIGAPAAVGDWHFATVEGERLSWLGYLRAEFGQGATFVPDDGGRDDVGEAQMLTSKAVAWQVAGDLLGQASPPAAGPVIVEVARASSASGRVRVGDVLISVEGAPAGDAAAAAEAIAQAARHGVEMTVRRGQRERRVSVPPTRSGRIGITVVDGGGLPQPAYPVPTGTVTGPSAGLALALAFVDARGGGNLSGGKTVAATGTVAPDGAVGTVAELEAKLVSVRGADADIFFVPDGQWHPRAARPRVVAVASVAEAVAWLCRHGGTSPACP